MRLQSSRRFAPGGLAPLNGNITLHCHLLLIVFGAIGGVLAALLWIALTLRGLKRSPSAALLTGLEDSNGAGRPRRTRSSPLMALVFAALGFYVIAGAAGASSRAAASLVGAFHYW